MSCVNIQYLDVQSLGTLHACRRREQRLPKHDIAKEKDIIARFLNCNRAERRKCRLCMQQQTTTLDFKR